MKNLYNLVFPIIAASVLSFNSLDSNSQSFLPGKFKDYHKKDKIILDSCIYHSKTMDEFFEIRFYDLDKDSLCDAIEIYPVKFFKDFKLKTKFPMAYFLDFNQNGNYTMFEDPNLDGFNGNEKIISDTEENKQEKKTGFKSI